jgi:hypothetical protein
MSAEAFVTRCLRLPRVTASQLQLPREIKVLPVAEPDHPTIGDVCFAVRLRDNFRSSVAILLNERHYVVEALLRAVRIEVIECCDKDPILVLCGLREVQSTYKQTAERMRFSQLPALDLEPFGDPAELPLEKKQKLIAVQLKTASTNALADDHPCKNIQPMPFKNYRLVKIPGEQKTFPWCEANLPNCYCMPLEAITTDKFAANMATIVVHRPFDAEQVAQAVSKTIPFVHISSKNTIRILLNDAGAATINSIAAIDGVAKICRDSDVMENKAPSFTRTAPKISGNKSTSTSMSLKETCGPLWLKVMKVDSSPFQEELGPKLAAFLRLHFVKFSEDHLHLWAKADHAEAAEMLNERLVGGVYRVLWPKAPEPGPCN